MLSLAGTTKPFDSDAFQMVDEILEAFTAHQISALTDLGHRHEKLLRAGDPTHCTALRFPTFLKHRTRLGASPRLASSDLGDAGQFVLLVVAAAVLVRTRPTLGCESTSFLGERRQRQHFVTRCAGFRCRPEPLGVKRLTDPRGWRRCRSRWREAHGHGRVR